MWQVVTSSSGPCPGVRGSDNAAFSIHSQRFVTICQQAGSFTFKLLLGNGWEKDGFNYPQLKCVKTTTKKGHEPGIQDLILKTNQESNDPIANLFCDYFSTPVLSWWYCPLVYEQKIGSRTPFGYQNLRCLNPLYKMASNNAYCLALWVQNLGIWRADCILKKICTVQGSTVICLVAETWYFLVDLGRTLGLGHGYRCLFF